MINEAAYATPGANPSGTGLGVRFSTDDYAMKNFCEKYWLLVDDSEEILTTLSAQCGTLTCAPIECHSSPESALAAFAAAPDKYELVITDYEMPGMNGVTLCRCLKAVAPGQKVILSTGSDFFTRKSAQNAGFDGLLNKPYRLSEIMATLAPLGVLKEADCLA
jgi:CheY-like chemotaxis protein